MKTSLIEKTSSDRGGLVLRSIRSLSVLALVLCAAGCHRDQIQVYRIAKDQDQQSSQPQSAPALPTDSPNPGLPPGHPDISSMPAGSFPAPSGVPQLTWQTPEGWTEEPPGQMRVASFKVTGPGDKQADVSVIPLPGMAGGDDANVNRWRSQVSLSAVSPDELQKSAEDVEVAGQSARLYDVAGQNPGSSNAERILGVIQHRDDMAWFFKMTGDADLVEQQKPMFVTFLKSLKFGAPAATAELPAGHPAVGNMNTPNEAAGPVSHEGQPNWQAPAGWQEVAAGQFLLAKFVIKSGNGATAEVNVAESGGEGGGLAANVNRWRGQLGLAPLSDADLNQAVTTLEVAGGKASLVDLTGQDARTGQPTRLIGVIVPQSGQTWFYKLMGDPQAVESQKAAFTQFVQGAKY